MFYSSTVVKEPIIIKAMKLNVLLLYSSQRAYHFSYRNNEQFKYSI